MIMAGGKVLVKENQVLWLVSEGQTVISAMTPYMEKSLVMSWEKYVVYKIMDMIKTKLNVLDHITYITWHVQG